MLPIFPAHLFARLAALSHDVTRDQIVRPQKYNQYASFLQEIEKQCIDLALMRSAKQIRAVLKATQAKCPPITFATLVKPIFPLLCEDLEERAFLSIPPQRLRLFKNENTAKQRRTKQIGGTKEHDEAAIEFQTARRCLGLGEPTACVLHLGRVIDFGAKVAAKSLNIKIEARTIGMLATDIQSSIRQLVKAGTCTLEIEEFYNVLVTDLRAFVRGYRNPSVHKFKQFNDREAFTLVTVVGDFMQHLEQNFIDWKNPSVPKTIYSP